MVSVLALVLALGPALTVLGPGALAPADAGVLEAVEARRVRHGWGLSEVAGPDVVRIAVEGCQFVGYDGLVLIEGERPRKARVVDCQRRDEQPRLSELGIVADVSRVELGHKQGTIILW